MITNSVRVLVAVIILSTTLGTKVAGQNAEGVKPKYEREGNYDWKKNMIIADRKRDTAGMLLPLQSYDETIRRGMSFLLEDHLMWFKGPGENLIDEKGQTQMPWVFYSNLQHNGEPFPNSIDRFVSYPAFHHSLIIETFIKYWKYSGNKQALKKAIKLADWNISHSTPGEWTYGNMPYSTFEEKKPGGFRDKSGLMPDKGAIMALAYIELYKASQDVRFLKAADAIGETLARNQRANGTWPFRVDPKSKKVIEDYTSSVIYAIMLFENLDKLNKNDHFKTYRDRTWKWLLNGPIKTKEFRGFYEDIPESTEGRTNYDCLDVIRYLLANRTDNNGYLEMAEELNAWIEDVFLDKIQGFEPAEGIREQLQCNVVMGIHSLNWASMLMDLSKATGDKKMRQRAMQTANYVTYYLQPDNRIVVGFQYNQWWYSCHAGVILYLFDFIEHGDHLRYSISNRFEKKAAIDPPITYQGERLTGLDFPIGALGGSLIRMNGKAERRWWQIFNNFEERAGSGIVPNSFFALRTKTKNATVVKALQTSSIGSFQAMDRLSFQGEYPLGWYNFGDDELPVDVTLEAYNPLIPMDLKNSAIPCGIFRVKVKNVSAKKVEINLLATQQNAVGFSGYNTIAGPNNRQCTGYGQNKNTIITRADKTSLQMTGTTGSMQLSAYAGEVSYSASWKDLTSLYNDFSHDGKLTGEKAATSPEAEKTVDGALSTGFALQAGEEKTITFVLSWHFPKGTFGRSDIPLWYFVEGGSQYENWWINANDVDSYVAENFDYLDTTTRLYHETMYSSTLPRYMLDRISSNLCVLKSPTSFWTKDGYFGVWESTSYKEEWFGNCKHVYHYAQGHARIFPELGRILRKQDLNTITDEGLLPSRDGEWNNAIDGHFGSILGVYREHLLSDNNNFLSEAWPRTKKAMDYTISTFDSDHDGMMSGTHHNTLDCNVSGTSPWIGSLYMAALKACEKMAAIMGETQTAAAYNKIWTVGVENQNTQLWSDSLGYYIEKPENLPNTLVMANAVSLDMLLGQWWANQLNLGQIYPVDRTKAALSKIFNTNKFTDPGQGYFPSFRDFLGTGDTGWQMFVHTDSIPANSIRYYNEVMSGFEYAAAATMLQYGMIDEGSAMVKAISQRYDGRFRSEGEVHLANNSCVFGTGSPFGEDECGDFYGRPLSSWSVLLALQGFIYDGPQQTIGFKPVLKSENHASFFTTSAAWGLFSQTQTQSEQTADIEVKFGTAQIKNIVLAAADKKTGSNITVKLDGVEQAIENTRQDGNVITINLKSAGEVKAGSTLTVSFALQKQ